MEGHARSLRVTPSRLRWKKPLSPVRVQLVKGMVVQIPENLYLKLDLLAQTASQQEADFHPGDFIRPRRSREWYSGNGRGIAQNIRARLPPFYSLKKRESDGTWGGLGLSSRVKCNVSWWSVDSLRPSDPEFDRLHDSSRICQSRR